jgi:hypothetical protein
MLLYVAFPLAATRKIKKWDASSLVKVIKPFYASYSLVHMVQESDNLKHSPALTRMFRFKHSASWGLLRSCLKETVVAPIQKTEINGRGNSLRWPRDTVHTQKLALTSPTSGRRSVGIFSSRTKATEFRLYSAYGKISQRCELGIEDGGSHFKQFL